MDKLSGAKMGKIKKLRGGNKLFVSGDGNILAGFSGQNIAYVYHLASNSSEPVFKIRTIRHLQCVAVSPDRKLLAAKSTTGEIAVFLLESGEELFRVKTKEMDGYEMYFTEDSRSLLDLGCSRIKLIDIERSLILMTRSSRLLAIIRVFGGSDWTDTANRSTD